MWIAIDISNLTLQNPFLIFVTKPAPHTDFFINGNSALPGAQDKNFGVIFDYLLFPLNQICQQIVLALSSQ